VDNFIAASQKRCGNCGRFCTHFFEVEIICTKGASWNVLMCQRCKEEVTHE
jgi:hypothetical protein